ncbi:DNA helicase [Tanacetum coccineum]
MKTKRKLVPKSSSDTGDPNVGPLDVADRTHDVKSEVPVKKQHVGGCSFVSYRPIDVGPSGVQNVPTVGRAVLSTTSVTQSISTSQRCNTLKSNPDTENRNVDPLDVPHRISDVSSNAFTKRQRLSDSSFVSSQPIDVGPSRVQNISPVCGTALPITGVNQLASTSQRCNVAPAAGNQSVVTPMFQQPEAVPSTVNNRSRARRDRTRHNVNATDHSSSRQPPPSGPPLEYKDLGNCDHSCQHCGALFWFEERLKSTPRDNEVDNRLTHFGGDNSVLRRDIVEGLIDLLDTHNALVQLFRTAREKFEDAHVPNFKVRLYNVIGAREYELPTRDMLGAIVYEANPESDMDYDIMLEERSGHPKRVNKLHPSYMSLQFPLLFIYGENGYSKDMKMIGRTGSSSENKRLTMLAYYSYYLHDRANRYNYLSRTGTLFQQYVVTAFCAVEQNRIDYICEHQNDIRNEYLSGIYDAINRGDNDGFDCGLKLILPQSFTGGPRYMNNPPSVDPSTAASTSQPQIVIDEIKNYLDARYVSPHEACWRIFEFEIHYREPAVQILAVHWQNKQLASSIRETRKLLCHQKGCTSFPAIRTVNEIVYPTCRDACEALGLLQDDQEWEVTLQEVALTATLAELRMLLAHILAYCEVSNPRRLWECTWRSMSEDIPYVSSISLNLPDLHIEDSDLEDYMLLLMEEKSYDRRLLAIERDKLLPMLNEKQREIFGLIVNACLKNEHQLVFVYGHGGTGKIFLWKTILYTLRCERKIVLAVASSGIAFLLLPTGRTAHSRFKIPLDLTDTRVCSIKKNTQVADLLKETCLIVWDESPMNDRRCFETLDRTLRDILNEPNHVFGGKTVMLGGDFRQTLLVKRGASRNKIIRSSIANSYLWPHFKIHYLTENMRLNNKNLSEVDNHRIAGFAQWLLYIGNGEIGIPDDSDSENTSWVNIPDEYCIPNDDNGITNLINFIYDYDTLQYSSAQKLQEKAIICPKNDMADVINNKIMSLLTTTTRTYLSYDEAIPHGHDGGEVELLYPKEYLNSLSFAGLPPHKLTLKANGDNQ